jgi:hypothetical protein
MSAKSKKLGSFRKKMLAVATAALITSTAHAGVIGPIIGDPTLLGTTSFSLSSVGYKQSEYFVSGMANSYTNTKPLTTDGKWSVKTVDQAYFNTRIVVYQPTDASKFNGTVIVEWFNISSGTEASSEWIMAHTELIRKGYAWVGVSAQKGGIDGGGINYLGLPLFLKLANPLRYITLWHPGDKYSYDIFSQAAKAVLQPGMLAPKPLGGLQVKRAIAAGESQSADFLLTYVNAVAPRDKLFDGYLIHSRLHGSADITSPQTTGSSINFASRSPVQVRNDLGKPVLMLQTETDLFVLGSYPDMQPDSANFRLWEVAGAAHADAYVSGTGATDLGNDPNIVAITENKSPIPILVTCGQPINAGPQHFVANAAISALDNWLRNGVAPAYADRLQVSGNPATFSRDSVGNAFGGIRTPYVDAPIATLSGEGQSGGTFCSLYGSTHLLGSTQLMSLYPNHATYVSAVNTSADNAVNKGFLLPPDANLIKSWAQSSTIGNY